MSNTKGPEDFLTRGTGNFINCTDYDDAVEACKKYSAQQNRAYVEALKKLSAAVRKHHKTIAIPEQEDLYTAYHDALNLIQNEVK